MLCIIPLCYLSLCFKHSYMRCISSTYCVQTSDRNIYLLGILSARYDHSVICCAMLQSAQKEISLWFKPEELADYDVMTKAAIYE